MITSFDSAKRLDFLVRKGNTFSKNIVVKNADGTNFDFTGYTATFKVYTSPFDTVSNLDLTVTLSSGNINLATSIANIAKLRRQPYIYFLVMTVSGNTTMWLNGKWIVQDALSEDIESDNQITIDPDGDSVTLTITGFGGDATSVEAENGVSISGGKVRLGGNPLITNTSIPGGNANLSVGTSDSKLANLYFYVTQIFQAIADAGLSLVSGTAQLVLNSASSAFFNENIFEFRAQASPVNILEITSKEDDVTAPKVTANEPLEIANIDSQESLDRIVTNNQLGKYRDGALVYYNLPGKQPAIAYTLGGTLCTLNSYIDIGRYSQPSSYAPSGFLQALRNFEIQNFLRIFDRLHMQFIVELEETAVSEFGIRMWHDPVGVDPPVFTDIAIIDTNTTGRYVIDVQVAIGVANVVEENLWKQFITVKITGPADENAAGYDTTDYPIQNHETIDGITAIQVIGKCALANTLRVIHQDGYIMRQQVEI